MPREQLFNLGSDALQQHDDVVTTFGTTNHLLVHFLYQNTVLTSSHLFDSPTHLLRRLKIVNLLALTLLLQFLGGIHDVVDLLLAALLHDVLHPLKLHQQGKHLPGVTVADYQQVVSQFDGRLVARAYRSAVGQKRIGEVNHRVAEGRQVEIGTGIITWRWCHWSQYR
ncbi:MAG: HD domain-containing protein [Prevotella sp.]|nr:HD domain-containing protein [Prevotella sp.]